MITIKLLRKGSLGLEGTIKNAKHHAKPCIPLINGITSAILGFGEEYNFTWVQGNNVHLITRANGDSLVFRPFSDQEDWGIDVLSRFSRTNEMRLFTITSVHEIGFLGTFLGEFLYCPENNYGSKEHANNSRAEV